MQVKAVYRHLKYSMADMLTIIIVFLSAIVGNITESGF